MRAQMRSVSVRWWRVLQRLLHATLVLMALLGAEAIPLRPAEAQATGNDGKVLAYFAASTQPPVCLGRTYKLFTEAFIAHPGSEAIRLLRIRTFASSKLGNTINPSDVANTRGGPSLFVYSPTKTGQEILRFGVFQLGYSDTLLGNGSLEFEVKECNYEISLVYDWPGFPGDPRHNSASGTMETTPLDMNSSGGLEGKGSLNLAQSLSAAYPCPPAATTFSSAVDMTGTIDTQNHELVLTLKFVKDLDSFSETCIEPGKFGGPVTIPIDTLGHGGIDDQTVRFPVTGGIRTITTQGTMPSGLLTITVIQKDSKQKGVR